MLSRATADLSVAFLPAVTLSVSVFEASDADAVSSCIDFTSSAISSADSLLFSASLRTSSATTANPLPASPALAASIAAFNASKFVWAAMSVIISSVLAISSPLCVIISTLADAFSATSDILCMLLTASSSVSRPA